MTFLLVVVVCCCLFGITDGAVPKAEAVFLKNNDTADILVLPADDYPPNLQGMFWMDQEGAIGFSNMSSKVLVPDLALSMGDAVYGKLNRTSRTIHVNVFGPGWSWQNNEGGSAYFADRANSGSLAEYEFVFNEDYSFAQIYPHVRVPLGGTVRIPRTVADFSMTRQHPAAGACPPPAKATKEQTTACAAWRRVTTFLKVIPGISSHIGTFVYHAYQIVDNHKRPVQPFYDQYLAFADAKCKPDPAALTKKGFNVTRGYHGASGAQPRTSIIGRYV